jgi:hypothetical protein
VPKLACCVFSPKNTLHRSKPVFLDMSNYTDEEQKVTKKPFSPMARLKKGNFALNGFCILLRILLPFLHFAKALLYKWLIYQCKSQHNV